MIERGRNALLSVSRDLINRIHKRYRYKPKWAVQLKSQSTCQKALDHFDAFYKPVYGDLWSPARLALLSLSKHCAVLNKFTDTDKVISKLEDLGCIDLLQSFKDNDYIIQPSASSSDPNYSDTDTHVRLSEDSIELEKSPSLSQNSSLDSKITLENTSEYEMLKKKGPSELKFVLSAHSLESYDEDLYKDNLDAFVPPEQILSDKDKLMEKEIQAVSFQSKEVYVDVIPMEPIQVPADLKAYAFPRGDVSRFPQPKAYNQKTGYYLMDAGSILPIIAMNLRSSDRILDMCAAPGGKSHAILQALNFNDGAELHCNDSSHGRLVRLKNILSSYFPTQIAHQIVISCMEGTGLQAIEFNKVLVDAPCNSDRHVVTVEDNNLFKQSRNRERLQIMGVQTDLLVSAIKLCRVGGNVIYSTCTMAPAQNDGVIQAAVEALSATTKIKVAVEDLTPMAHAFKENFKFFDKCRFGQLVLPSLVHNFGPTYFAKLRRLS